MLILQSGKSLKKAETKFKERVQADLGKLRNCWFVKIQQVSIRGIPDFLLCINGTFIAIELKRSEDATRNALQDWTLQCIAHAGGLGFVVFPENWEETYALFEDMDEEGDYDYEEDETEH